MSQTTFLSNQNTPVDLSDKTALKLTKGVKVGNEQVIDNTGDVPKKVSKVKGLVLSPNFFTDEEKEALELLFSKLNDSGLLKSIVLGYIVYDAPNEEYKFYKNREGSGTQSDPYVYKNWIQYDASVFYKDLASGKLYTWDSVRGYTRILDEEDYNTLDARLSALENM